MNMTFMCHGRRCIMYMNLEFEGRLTLQLVLEESEMELAVLKALYNLVDSDGKRKIEKAIGEIKENLKHQKQ